MFIILTITLSLFNENEKLFYQNNQRKRLYSVQYERKFSEYPSYLFMRKNKNVHAFLTPHCIDSDGAYEVKVAVAEQAIVQARIQSPHANSIQYHVWLKYSSKEIQGWYCTCTVGSRIIGCCAHVSSLIWYLALARYNPHELSQRSSLHSNHILDTAEEELSNGSDSENEGYSQMLCSLTHL